MRNVLLVLAAVLTAATVQATTYTYDAYVTPGTLPQNIPSSPWTSVGADGSDTETASGRLLTLSAANNVDPGPYYYAISGTSGIVDTNDEYEIRSRVRVPSSSSVNPFPDRALYHAYIGDGTRLAGFGVTNISANMNAIFLINSGVGPLVAPYIATLGNDDFFNIRMTKTGTTGGAGDTVNLFVDGVLAQSVSYTALSSYTFPELLFGNSASQPFGLTELTGASFGINEAAFALLPEPSAIVMVLASAALLLRRHRRAVS